MADPIHRLVQHLARLPGVGEKTATRLAIYLIQAPASSVRELAAALVEVVEKVRLCQECMNVSEQELCSICTDPNRDAQSICVVATPTDLIAIDRAGQYRGRYHVLHGLLSPLDGVTPDDLRIRELLSRLTPCSSRTPSVDSEGESPDTLPQEESSTCGELGTNRRQGTYREVIVATSASVEGEATAMYLARLIKPLGLQVTRIASGIPVGGELEYTDSATIARALNGRSAI